MGSSNLQPETPAGRDGALAGARVDWRGLAAFSLPLLIYVRTLAPTIYNLDSAELTTAAATGGLTRATGYPLYLMLGWLWAHLPVGDVGYRMNLLSAVCGAATVYLADRILRRLAVGPLPAMGALGLLATAPFFWGLALVAEVYTLHTALMAGIILLLLRWRERPTALRLGLLTLIGGMSMGHHLATAMLVPGCAAFVLGTAPRQALRPGSLAAAAAGGLAGLAVYLYLPLRALAGPAFNYAGSYDAAGVFHPLRLWEPATLWWLVSGRQFAGQMLGYDAAGWAHEAMGFGAELFRSFFAVGVGPGLVGLAALLRRDRWLGLGLLLMFSLSAGFYVGYRVVDKQTMYLPAYLVWAIWAGFGYQQLMAWIGQEGRPRYETLLLKGIMLGSAVAALLWGWPAADHSNDWSARARGEELLAAAAPDGLVFGWWDTVPLVEYHQLVEGRRHDLVVINRFLIRPADMLALIEREAPGRPVYIDTPTAELLRRYNLEPAGPVYRLRPRAMP
ncbi:MAG: DUF2723 domain-containing protein [Chloroflexales bacterium]|nr:DUF2723 domain-containing protein [Chloroflexales bacterium]